MIDQNLLQQLVSLFEGLKSHYTLSVYNSDHEKQAELIEFLNTFATSSSAIDVRLEKEERAIPGFTILKNDKRTNVSFEGIPGGHEFSSLVLAILNADGKGKIPDEGIQNRIKSLKGPISLRTYISLSCENCPDVVQALNLISLLHDDFDHTMVDGEFVQEELRSLNIQGVPSVINEKKLIHSGKSSLIELLEKLENEFGVQKEKHEVPRELGFFDVLIIGGGPAGASASIYSARKGLKTAVIAEKIGGQVQETKGIENLISIPYTEGPKLSAQLLEHMKAYPINLFEHRRVVNIKKKDSTFALELNSKELIEAKSLIITTGAKWRELNIPGEKEYIGRGVAFCPHCDGPYYKGKTVAVIGGGNSGVEAAIDLAGIVKEITLIEYGPELRADKVLQDKLKSLSNVSILTNAQTLEVVGDGAKVNSLVYKDRTTQEHHSVPLDGVFVQIGLVPNTTFLKELVELSPQGEIIVDEKGRTSFPGIYAAGDATTTPFKQIIIAMGEGAKAALAAFEDTMIRH